MINPESLKNILLKMGLNNISLSHKEDSWVIEYTLPNKRKGSIYPNYELGVLTSKIQVANTKQELALVSINLVLPFNRNICVEAVDPYANSIDIYYVQSFSIKQIKAPVFNNLIPYVIKGIVSKLNKEATEIANCFNLLNYQINVLESKDFPPYEDEEEIEGDQPLEDLF